MSLLRYLSVSLMSKCPFALVGSSKFSNLSVGLLSFELDCSKSLYTLMGLYTLSKSYMPIKSFKALIILELLV